jgi:hypothetical protein
MMKIQTLKIQEKPLVLKFRSLLIYGLIGILAITPYLLEAPWKFLPSLLAIVFLMRWQSRSYVFELGLKISKIQFTVAIFVFAITMAVAKHTIPFLLNDAGIYLYHGDQWNLAWALMPISQSLLEELVLRALLLNGLLFYFQRKKYIAIVAAMIFMLWHLIYFPLAQDVWLSGMTLFTLFLFGYASNNFFLTYRNIAIPFALHGGWNIVKFSGEYFSVSKLDPIAEAQAFNAVEGSWKVLILALGLVVVSELIVCFKTKNKRTGGRV